MADKEIKISETEEMAEKDNLLSKNFKYPVSIGYAALVTGCVFGFVAVGLILFDAPLELMFLLSWIVVVPLLMRLGYRYGELQEMAWEMAAASFEPNVVLIVIGAMIAVWIASGTIPMVIYMGLKFISPKIFLLSALILSSFTSLATGTSWGTLGTVKWFCHRYRQFLCGYPAEPGWNHEYDECIPGNLPGTLHIGNAG
ncbi:hypothetical protein QMP26_27240 [Enterocloster clostridioformis]|uniref:hypothetical protein n=1 Tax=Enterocloster clostridioformis TaxID=1531 RepID=UPI002675A806|nr:hypothetical protein [Enterocloster clostridioformis]